MKIKSIIKCFNEEYENKNCCVYGWVRTVRSSSNQLLFCIINDGSNVNGLQLVLSIDFIDQESIILF